MTILLAEDNPADVYLLREALASAAPDSIDLMVVSDGEEALDFVAGRGRFDGKQAVDLVVLDLNLPKNDGAEVLRTLRGSARFSSVPVVILTSSDSPLDKANAQRLGASCYITKPSDLDEFLALGPKLMRFASHGGTFTGISSR
jgi:CheY-like chemotaxis protein